MVIKDNVYDVLKRGYENRDVEWTSNTYYEIRKALEDTYRLMKSWYVGKTMPDKMEDVIQEYFDRAFDGQNTLGVNFGYMYFNDQVEKFLHNPNSMWEVYDELKDKVNLYEDPFIRYTPNEKQNRQMFLREVFSILVTEMQYPRILIDSLDEKTRSSVAELVAKYYDKKGKVFFEQDCRSRLIEKIKEAVSKLDELNVFDKDRDVHNDKMNRLGLEALCIPKDVVPLEDDKLLGRELKDCSILELECMLSFYFNQLEKVREDIGFSLFVLKELETEKGLKEKDLKSISGEELKKIWKKYYVLSKISDEVFDTIHKMEIEAEWKLDGDKLSEAYSRLFGKYIGAYSKLIYGIEIEDTALENVENQAEIEEKNNRAATLFEKDIHIFTLVNASFKMNNYLIKSRLMEDIISQADRQNLNWGVMEEEGEINIKKVLLIGVDVPGLNMPLRLHYETDNVQDFMHNYLKKDEVPIYIGSDDFNTLGKKEGTPLLIPMTKKESNYIKSISKKASTLPVFTSRFVKHLALAQMPNMVKRLLKEKTDGEQEVQDSINIFTKKIVKAARKKKYSPGDDSENR